MTENTIHIYACFFSSFRRHIRNSLAFLGEANGVIVSELWSKKMHTTIRSSLSDHSHNPPCSFSYPIGCSDAKEPVEKTKRKE